MKTAWLRSSRKRRAAAQFLCAREPRRNFPMAVQLGFPDKYYICARYGTEVLLNDASISDSDKLLIYALGQQAEYGENKTPKPSIFDTVARAKWNAWAELGKRSPFEAMFMYTQAVDELAPEWWKWPPLKLVEGMR